MPTGDVSTGVDHHHQDRTDSKRGELAAAADCGTEREHQEERADRFGGVLHSRARSADDFG
jgi:hypothetical protein